MAVKTSKRNNNWKKNFRLKSYFFCSRKQIEIENISYNRKNGSVTAMQRMNVYHRELQTVLLGIKIFNIHYKRT